MSSPRALVLNAPRELAFEPIEDRAARHRMRSASGPCSPASAPGTELSQYRGTNPFMHRRWDEAVAAVRRGRGAELAVSRAQPGL